MNYYNEAKSERMIRRKAMFFTVAILFISFTAVYFTSSAEARKHLPDVVKELFRDEVKEAPDKKKAKQAFLVPIDLLKKSV